MKIQDSILLIEDNEDDVFFMKRALASAHIRMPLQVIEDGRSALEYLAKASREKEGVVPRLILLDLKLPLVPGLEVLKEIRSIRELDDIHVVVLVSCRKDVDTQKADSGRASAYLVKPPTPETLLDLLKSLKLDHLGN